MALFSGLGLSLTNWEPVRSTLAIARRADELGFDEVSIPESGQYRSLFTVAGAVLATTEHVRLRIGTANPVTRHPITLAMEAASLEELAPGRVRFGVSAAVWIMERHGFAPSGWKPHTHMVETMRALRELLAGRPLGFDPTTFRGSPATVLEFAPQGPIPLDVGAVNARMLRTAGELADGVQLGALTSAGYAAWAREQVDAGAAAAGRDPADLLVAGSVLTSVDRDREKARDAVREVIAYWLSRVEDVVVEHSGADRGETASVRRIVAERGVGAGAEVVTDHLVDTFAVAGTADDVIAGLVPFADAGLDLPLAWYTLGPDRDRAIETLALEVRPAVC